MVGDDLMKTNFFSVIFWFNIFDNHKEILDDFQVELKDEYEQFNVFNYTDNLVAPIISAVNNKKMTTLSFSQINLQYSMDKVSFNDFEYFKDLSLKLFEILTSNNIEISHTSVVINGEIINDNALHIITKNTVSSRICSDDLVDMTLKLGKKHDDLFYKIITIMNKKQIKLPHKVDEAGRAVPIPLISWNGSLIENEIVEITYEINDKYLFDSTKNYQTTEFYLNKMLYILNEDINNDIKCILERGEF